MKSGIYKITNTVNGKLYVGSAVDLQYRQRQHISNLMRGVHCNKKLQNAWTKYGPEAFEFSTLLICAPEHLLDYEQRCIDGFDAVKSGYNIQPTAGSALGMKRGPLSTETKAKMSEFQRNRIRSQLPSETRRKISEAQKGRTRLISEEHRQNMSLGHIGKPMEDHIKRKVSEGLKRYYSTVEVTRSPHSKETKEKISLAHKGKILSPETRLKMSIASRAREQKRREVKALQFQLQTGDCSSGTAHH